MTYFLHYKNKPYRLIGEAKHSETLDDVVIYECLYDNPTAKLWVRPKTMFYESVDLNGTRVPRFKKVPIEIDTTSTLDNTNLESLTSIAQATFPQWDQNWFAARIRNHTRFCLATAKVEQKVVAFKLGYELDPGTFYSWLGAVRPDYRRLGIASELMRAQHDWCRAHGYKKIETKSQNCFREMMMLNLKFGFTIIGTHLSERDRIKIIFEKTL